MSTESSYRGMPQLSWDLSCLGDNRRIHSKEYPAAEKVKRRAYSVKLLRYWFIYQFLRTERELGKKPLAVCEVGIDRGQMRRFVDALDSAAPGDHIPVASWIGVDCNVRPAELQDLRYTSLVTADIETSDAWLDGASDVTILLHVLEHLREPEKIVAQIARKMKPGSVLVGGSPSFPHVLVPMREWQLRNRPQANPHDHVSKLSLKRIRTMAEANGLMLEFAAGAFMTRMSGSWIEDFRWWPRFNLLFGGLFPWWPGELYWVLRKPLP